MAESAPYGLELHELDELHEFLARRAESGGLMLDAVHGLLTAVVIGPEPIPASEWMTHVVQTEENFASEDEANRILALLIRLYNSIVQELDSLSYQPIFGEVDDDTENESDEPGGAGLSARGWCEGFSLGVDLRGKLWEGRMRRDPQLLDLLNPVIALAAEEGMLETDEGELIEPLSDDEFEDALNHVAGAVADVQQYWRNQPPQVEEGLPNAPVARRLLRKRDGQWLH